MFTLPTTRTSYVARIGDFGRRSACSVELPEDVEAEGGVRLLLLDACVRTSRRSFWADYQAYRGVLRVPGRLRKVVPVEVELSPWSTGRTEVGLRFVRPVREGNRRYFDPASRAVEALVRQLEKRAATARPDALRGQVAQPAW